MFDCPNCGEPVKNESSFCPHCGSDAETGWKPDVDYYSIELPEDDDYEMENPPTTSDDSFNRFRNILGLLTVLLCYILFVIAGYKQYGHGIIPAAVFLMIMTLVFLGRLGKSQSQRPLQ